MCKRPPYHVGNSSLYTYIHTYKHTHTHTFIHACTLLRGLSQAKKNKNDKCMSLSNVNVDHQPNHYSKFRYERENHTHLCLNMQLNDTNEQYMLFVNSEWLTH